MSVTYQNILDAIFAAVQTASGLGSDRIIWAWQRVPEPQLDDPLDTPTGKVAYIKLGLGSIGDIGQDWIEYGYNEAAEPGQEISATPRGFRDVPLEVQVFTTSTADAAAAIFVAEQMRTQFILPQVREPLAAVGTTVIDKGRVGYAPYLVSANFRGRATCTMRLNMPAIAAAQLYGYIAEMAGTTTISGGKQASATTAYDTPFDSPNDGE